MEIKKRIKNIDMLQIGKTCNNVSGCRQCLLGEKAIVRNKTQDQIGLYESLKKSYPDSKFFFYPPEISNSRWILDFISETGQKAMTNGLYTDEAFLDLVVEKGIRKLSFSLYANAKDQAVFYNTTEEQYENILGSISGAVIRGIEISVFSIVTPDNLQRVEKLYRLAQELGISRLDIMRLVPIGKARKMSEKYFLKESDLEPLLKNISSLKKGELPYISMSMSFGPNFYNNSVNEFFRPDKKDSWVNTETLCPSIDSEYAGVLADSKKVVWCFQMADMPGSEIGYVENGKIIIEKDIGMSRDDLRKNLEGICSGDNCAYQKMCLGGCRSTSVAFALRQGSEKNPDKLMYSGMPFCITNFLSKRPELRKDLGYK